MAKVAPQPPDGLLELYEGDRAGTAGLDATEDPQQKQREEDLVGVR